MVNYVEMGGGPFIRMVPNCYVIFIGTSQWNDLTECDIYLYQTTFSNLCHWRLLHFFVVFTVIERMCTLERQMHKI